MNTEDNWSENKKKITVLILLASAVLIAILSSMPIVQNRLHSLFKKESRVVLAKITGYFGLSQTEYLILKIKDELGLQIEIYENQNIASAQIFRQRLPLPQDSDAYITLDKNTTNLALSDVDKDNQLDILAPSVDLNGNLRLNVFRFNEELKIFEPLVQN